MVGILASVLLITNFFALLFSVVNVQCNEVISSVFLYYKVWHIENLNILGKILISITITPFTIGAQLIILLTMLIYHIGFYIVFRFLWLFANDRDDVVWEWLGEEYVGQKHKFINYIKEMLHMYIE